MNVAVARVWALGTATYMNAASSLRVVDTWRPQTNELVNEAVRNALADGVVVAIDTQVAAHALSALLVPYGAFEITVESTGEISFEWYKDRNHVAVLTVDGMYLRWAAMLGPDRPISGRFPFNYASAELPSAASEAIVTAS